MSFSKASRTISVFLLAMFAAAGAAGCGNRASGGAPVFRYGRDLCAECRMIISDERFAAAYSGDGQDAKYDSLGCVVHAHQAGTGGKLWVRSYRGPEWLDARSAYFVESRKLVTPMGMGAAAFRTLDEARGFAAETEGRVLDFNELVSWMGQQSSN